MSVKKCTSQEASFYVNDLFELLDIKGNNQLLFNQFCSLLMKFSKDTVKKAWKDIVYSCEPPNGQMAGRLPKMHIIEQILYTETNFNLIFLAWVLFAAISPGIIAFSLYTKVQKFLGASLTTS